MTEHADVLVRYIWKYGDKINIAEYAPCLFLKAIAEMAKVLDGERDPITEDEFKTEKGLL